jgi:hypothetical protein
LLPSIRVLRKVIAGNVSASKKSAERRWASRCASRVSMLAVPMVMSTTPLLGALSSVVTVPLTSPKRPRTVVIIKWRTENSTLLCAGSIFHVVVAGETTVLIVNSSMKSYDLSNICYYT